jgi:hypothetical protein
MIFLKGVWSGATEVLTQFLSPERLYAMGQIIGSLVAAILLLATFAFIVFLFCRLILWIDK